MLDATRALQPLADAEPAIRSLHEYADPEEMARAVVGVRAAVERVLRLLLRADTRAPDEARLHALSHEAIPLEEVIRQLRAGGLLTLELAGLVHELIRAAERARAGQVHAADADLGIRTVDLLRTHVHELAAAWRAQETEARAGGAGAARPAGVAGVAGVSGAAPPAGEEPAGAARAPRSARYVSPRRARWAAERRAVLRVAAAVTGILVAVLAALLFLRRDDSLARGIAAFEAGELTVAESHFREAAERDADDVTARLYLARIFRRQSRAEEAAAVLQEAARIAPNDPAVRRELGYLFLDLGQPASAANQFRRALAEDPESTPNWVGLIRALRAAGDPSAAEVLARAPAEVRSHFAVPN